VRYMLLIYGEESQQEGAAGGAAAANASAAGATAANAPGAAGSSDDAPETSPPWIEYTNWLLSRGIHAAGERLRGSPSATTVRVRDGNRLITDGPYAETKEVLGGYYIIDCDNLDEALEAAARCPGAAFGSVEVRPLIGMRAGSAAR
jgi:hypothetical protein